MRLIYATDKTWWRVLYQHTIFVISLSNISIKTNFEQLRRIKFKLANMYNTLRENTFCTWCHMFCCRSFTNVIYWNYDNMIMNSINEWTLSSRFVYVAYIDVFPYAMVSWQSSLAEKLSCNDMSFFYSDSVVIQHLVSNT